MVFVPDRTWNISGMMMLNMVFLLFSTELACMLYYINLSMDRFIASCIYLYMFYLFIYLSNLLILFIYLFITEGSLEVKLPTIWTVGKAEVGRVREEKRRSEKIREEKE